MTRFSRTFVGCVASAPLLALVSAAACTRPPVGDGDGKEKPIEEGHVGPVDIARFQQDRPAIAGKWYDYDPSTHTQEPKPQAWIVRDTDGADGVRYAAFRIVSIYDDTDSGLFTLARATWSGTAWSGEVEYVSPHNEKLDGPVCLDAFLGDDSSCSGDAWNVKLIYSKYFAPQSLFFVNNPNVFVRSLAGTDAYGTARIARVNDITSLAELPDPTSLAELDPIAPAPTYEGTDWDFAALSPDLPEAGMAIGARFAARPADVWFFLTFRLDVVRATFALADDRLTVSAASLAMDYDNLSIRDHYDDLVSAVVPVPAADGATYMHFDKDGFVTVTHGVADGWPYERPLSADWDVALERAGERLRILVSPSASVVNATALQVDEALPPIYVDPEE